MIMKDSLLLPFRSALNFKTPLSHLSFQVKCIQNEFSSSYNTKCHFFHLNSKPLFSSLGQRFSTPHSKSIKKNFSIISCQANEKSQKAGVDYADDFHIDSKEKSTDEPVEENFSLKDFQFINEDDKLNSEKDSETRSKQLDDFAAWKIDGEGDSDSSQSIPYYNGAFPSSSLEGLSLGAKEPVYSVLEVDGNGKVSKQEVTRRQLLKTSGLRQRDIRRVDPSLWVTNSAPAILVRDNAILINLGSLRAIATSQSVLIFDFKSVGAQTFIEGLLEKLKLDADAVSCGLPVMPFELEVVEAALSSRTQRLENALMDVEPRVISLLKTLPNTLAADVLEELRLSKQALVELGAKAGALRHMLLELLEAPSDIKKMASMNKKCKISRSDNSFECVTNLDRIHAEEEEEEVEMLLEYYLQKCDSCHGQAEKLLDSAKETEDSISVNLSSRRLEVSRLELLLQVGTFAAALGALIAGIFGMNLRSRLEDFAFAFWLTTGGIVLGGISLFFYMFMYLKKRRIL